MSQSCSCGGTGCAGCVSPDDLYDSTRESWSPSEIPADWKPSDEPSQFFVRHADALFRAVERAITSGRINSRSEIGDAALDYRQYRQEMADRSSK